MITVRNDDVLSLMHGYTNVQAAVTQFKQYHELIAARGALHIPTVICKDIQQFPEAIEYIREKIAAGEMQPQIHGWEHIPYHRHDRKRIEQDLTRCQQFFADTWNLTPSKFYTPWGGNSVEIQAACDATGLELVDTSNITDLKSVAKDREQWAGKKDVELYSHWWQHIGRLEKALAVLNLPVWREA